MESNTTLLGNLLMWPPADLFILLAASPLIVSLIAYMVSSIMLNKRLPLRVLWYTLAFNIITVFCAMLATNNRTLVIMSNVLYLFPAAGVTLCKNKPNPLRFLLRYVLGSAIVFLAVILLMFIVFGSIEFDFAQKRNASITLLLLLLISLACIGVLFFLWFFNKKRIPLPKSSEFFVMIILFLIIAMPFFPISWTKSSKSDIEMTEFHLHRLSWVVPSCISLLSVGYMLIHHRLKRQYIVNKSFVYMEQTQKLQLDNFRQYRHNFTNMLYGFDGILEEDNIENAHAYYLTLANTYKMMNGSNLFSIQKIGSPKLRSILLAELQSAKEVQMPMHIICDDLDKWCKTSDNECCKQFGDMLSVARSEAIHAVAPFVIILIRSENGKVEFVVKNAIPPSECDTCSVRYTKSLSSYIQGQYRIQQLFLS